MIWTALLGAWKLVGWRGLIVAAIIAAGAWWHLARISEAYDDGAHSVRVQWQEANRRAELAAIERQQKQQDEINRVEIDLLNSRALSATRIRSLEEALEAERAENETNGVDLSACRLPDRVRDQLLYRKAP